jgi:hypothetical protein
MAKKITGYIKLQVPAGKANPSAPHRSGAGSARSEHHGILQGVQRQDPGLEPGLPIPVVITAFADKSFTFIMKTPPATVLIKKAIKLDKGSRRSRIPTRWAPLRAPRWKKSPRPRCRSDRGRHGRGRAHHCRHGPQHGHQRGGSLRWLTHPSACGAARQKSTVTATTR